MHTLHGVGYHRVDGCDKSLVLRTLIIRIDGILFVEVVVVIHEEDGAETAIFFYLSHYTTDTIAVIRVVLHRQTDAVVACGQKDGLSGLPGIHIPAYPLMHHGFQVMGSREVLAGFRPAFRHRIFREEFYGDCPFIAVF